MAKHNELGTKGEQLAVNYLQEHNYTIVERNYRFDKAEVDIIAKKKNILAIIEVKTVDEYVTTNDLDVEVRFDIIAIVKEKSNYNIEHLKDAFYHF